MHLSFLYLFSKVHYTESVFRTKGLSACFPSFFPVTMTSLNIFNHRRVSYGQKNVASSFYGNLKKTKTCGYDDAAQMFDKQ